MMKEHSNVLKLVPSLRARRLAGGRIGLTRKFIDGVNEFKKYWEGPIVVYLGPMEHDTSDLDEVAVWQKDLSFEIQLLSLPEIEEAIASDRCATVLLSLDDYRQRGLWRICRERAIVCSYISEYSLTTRHQIIDLTTSNPLIRVRRKIWESSEERKRRVAVAGATGLQCNGTPTFEAYRELRPDALLFFDSRVSSDLLATDQDILRRLGSPVRPRRLRLLFSGRLAQMKGAADLVTVAKNLRRLGVDFHLSICGDGELKTAMAQSIDREQLAGHVTLKGVLDFRRELVPLVKSNIDLFLCCHPQGDPSCTYLETMSCGVPIAGYANEAFTGIVRLSQSGWAVPLNDPGALARQIMLLEQTPRLLLEHSVAALNFARHHTLQETFYRRACHLQHLQDNRFPSRLLREPARAS